MNDRLEGYSNVLTSAAHSAPTLVSRLSSGLGNQLFQFACGLHLQTIHKCRLLFDLSWFKYFQRHQPKRAFLLDALGLVDSNKDGIRGSLSILLGLATANHCRSRMVFQTLLRTAGVYFINEHSAFKNESVLYDRLPTNTVILNGYWQTYDHAQAVATGMRQRIFANWRFSSGAEECLTRIRSTRSIFLHIRRGDYLGFGVPVLPASYYKNATDAALALDPQAEFYVFTEDYEWAKENLSFLSPVHFVNYASNSRDIEDLLLMAECQGGIIANSSFSWWGAALGSHGREIWAPSTWTMPGNPVPPALYPPDWKCIEE